MAKGLPIFNIVRRELRPVLSSLAFSEARDAVPRGNVHLKFQRDPGKGGPLGFWVQRDVKAFDGRFQVRSATLDLVE